MPKASLDRCDAALLVAFLVAAGLGTWNRALLLNDGAVLLSVGWLGDAWDLYFNQIAARAVSTFISFAPAWAARWMFGLSSATYITLAHLLYFATPLALWFLVRAVEPQRVFSRLYLAAVLALIYFPSELIVGIGLWMIWAALIADPARSARQAVAATALLGVAMAFTHPSTALMSLLYLVLGGTLAAFGRPFPRRTLLAAGAMSLLLLAAYALTSVLLPPTNPTIVAALVAGRYDHVDPVWILATLGRFPMLAALWLLLLAPGAINANLRWRLSSLAVTIVAAFGLWFAANGTGLLTWLYARHSGAHVLVLALALALAGPAAGWLAEARRPLMLYAAIAIVASLSYNFDILLYGRFVDRLLAPGAVDIDGSWPAQQTTPYGARVYFKWMAEPDYVRDVVVADYGRYRLSPAFYGFFRSDRRSVPFRHLPEGEWIPFECAPVERALARAHDALDAQFLRFLGAQYCVK